MTTLLERIPSWFRETKEGKKLVAEAQKSAQTERDADVAEIARLHKELADGIPAHNDVVKEKEVAARAAQDRLKNKTEELGRARGARADFVRWHEVAIAKIERRLFEGADPRIDLFVAELEQRFRSGRAKRPCLTRAHLVGLRGAIESAEDLRLQACDDVPGRFQKIWAAIPPEYANGVPEREMPAFDDDDDDDRPTPWAMRAAKGVD